MNMTDKPRNNIPLVAMLAIVALATLWSAIGAHDYATWFFELVIGAAGIAALASFARWFRFSPLVYFVAAAHFVILAIGAKYTYALAPPGEWLRDALGLARNPFDRLGHFAQGFTPALIMRELLVRVSGLSRGWLVNALSVSVALAFSALYEILEWGWVMAFYPDEGPEWLGMQGDPWDAQWDMFMALSGALAALVLLGPWQNRWLTRK
jgi:putative membrane protein